MRNHLLYFLDVHFMHKNSIILFNALSIILVAFIDISCDSLGSFESIPGWEQHPLVTNDQTISYVIEDNYKEKYRAEYYFEYDALSRATMISIDYDKNKLNYSFEYTRDSIYCQLNNSEKYMTYFDGNYAWFDSRYYIDDYFKIFYDRFNRLSAVKYGDDKYVFSWSENSAIESMAFFQTEDDYVTVSFSYSPTDYPWHGVSLNAFIVADFINIPLYSLLNDEILRLNTRFLISEYKGIYNNDGRTSSSFVIDYSIEDGRVRSFSISNDNMVLREYHLYYGLERP